MLKNPYETRKDVKNCNKYTQKQHRRKITILDLKFESDRFQINIQFLQRKQWDSISTPNVKKITTKRRKMPKITLKIAEEQHCYNTVKEFVTKFLLQLSKNHRKPEKLY